MEKKPIIIIAVARKKAACPECVRACVCMCVCLEAMPGPRGPPHTPAEAWECKTRALRERSPCHRVV